MTTPQERIIRGIVWAVLVAGIGLITWSVVAPPTTPSQAVPTAPEPFVADAPTGEPAVVAAEAPAAEPSQTVVYVTGAVARPGLYALAASARVGEAVTAAGGVTADAAYESINMAAHVTDAAHIHVPRTGETLLPTPATAQAGADGTIAINDADAAGLMALPGVGAGLAARIIAYRDAHGPFRSIADLDAVSGVGAALLQKLEPLIRF